MTTTTPGTTGSAVRLLATLRDTVGAYRTCEFATIGRDGVPITWPAVCLVSPEADRITLTTCIALPVKAINVRRDPRVALLFSDPTGTGRADLPQVLVQGRAECPDLIRTSPAGLEEYWRRLAERQPDSGTYGSSPVARWLFDFYYMRLVITVTPEAVTTRAPLPRPVPIDVPSPARATRDPYAELASHDVDGVLGAVGADGLPVLRRVRPTASPDRRSLVLRPLDGDADPLPPGPANLMFHRHDEKLGGLRQLGAVGELGGAEFRPTRVLPGATASNPVAMVRTVRRLRAAAERYLDRRGLDRPVIPWDEYAALRR